MGPAASIVEQGIQLATLVVTGAISYIISVLLLWKVSALPEGAERLLMRCRDENSETPWAYLAERELQHELGISVRQLTLEPVAARAKSAPNLPKF